MKLPILLASAFLAGTFSFGTASAAPLSSTMSLKNVDAGQVETVRYRRHHRHYSHRAYRSFAFAPRFRSGRSFGAVRSCNTIRPWKDEAYNSAYPSWRCH
jgi:hypothetical protein